jgi:hypothetical protein
MFVTGTPGFVQTAINTVRELPVVTVTDNSTYPAIVNFVTVHDKIRFNINIEMASQNKISFSSRLLALPWVTRREAQPEHERQKEELDPIALKAR